MSDALDPSVGVPPPSAGTLEALPPDVWAQLIPAVRAGLQELEDHETTAAIRRLRATPTGRLAGGRVRHELCVLLARGGAPWTAVLGQLQRATGLAPALRAVARGEEPDLQSATAGVSAPPDDALQQARQDADRARSRARAVREERDAARRRAEAAERQAASAERRAASADTQLAELRAEVAALGSRASSLERALEDADSERRRAVEREKRRRDAEVERLRAELTQLRRAEEERRLAARRRDEARRQAEQEAQESADAARRQARAERGSRVVPGRPSVLPEGVAPDTAEAVEALLHPGRLVLVDGYNVTLQHRGHLPLETQRTWLTQLLATAVAQRRIRPVAFFDGERAGGGRPPSGSREVEVRFTPAGITADDELVLAVEATDEPVLVVTDDRELRARVRGSGADVVGTAAFLWALT